MTRGFDLVSTPFMVRWTADGRTLTYLESRNERTALWRHRSTEVRRGRYSTSAALVAPVRRNLDF